MFGVEDDAYYAGLKVGHKRWKHAAKLLFTALEKSRRRTRRLQCRLDDVLYMQRGELDMRNKQMERLIVENLELQEQVRSIKK